MVVLYVEQLTDDTGLSRKKLLVGNLLISQKTTKLMKLKF